jgi:hypothetical protein
MKKAITKRRMVPRLILVMESRASAYEEEDDDDAADDEADPSFRVTLAFMDEGR